MPLDAAGPDRNWYEIVRDVLKQHKVRLVTYVPDNVLRPLIELIEADPFFTCFVTAREEEALGIVAGAWMGGLHGIVLMQTSGFATLPNAIASLADGFRTRHAGRIQHRAGAGRTDDAAGAGFVGDGAPHADAARRGRVRH
jgi:sulfopyruvate decarboxylase TPP-binding subunit